MIQRFGLETKTIGLTAKELAAKLADHVLVDIRRPEEWQLTGVIDGSHLLTFYDASGNADVAGWMAELTRIATPDDELVLICRSGYRTGIILDFLHAQTPYKQAQHLTNGILGWLEQGLSVVSVND